jgi:hypothetical protein
MRCELRVEVYGQNLMYEITQEIGLECTDGAKKW